MNDLKAFITKSNRIEGIIRPPTKNEISATQKFLALKELKIDDVCALVDVYAPGKKLRLHPGMDVRVGSYYPPSGGMGIGIALKALLEKINAGTINPWTAHLDFESLHPFEDGNGRSGRAIWAWHMRYISWMEIGFLHAWYYQTLKNVDR